MIPIYSLPSCHFSLENFCYWDFLLLVAKMITYAQVMVSFFVTCFSSKAFVHCYAGHKDSFFRLAFSTDGQLLASGGFHGLVQNRDTSSGNLQCTVEGPRGGIEVRLLKFSVILCLHHYFENEALNIWLLRIPRFGCGMLIEVLILICFQVMVVAWLVVILLLMVLITPSVSFLCNSCIWFILVCNFMFLLFLA